MKFFLFILVISSVLITAQEIVTLKSENTPFADTSLVFTPKNYNKSVKYPAVFLLHGWGGNHYQWSEFVNLRKLSDDYNFIIICPDAFNDSWYVNNPVRKNSRYADFFIKELIPYITNKYSVNKENIFVSGLSMGGFGAVSFFLDNQNLFKSCASTSGVLNLKTFKNSLGLEKAIGIYEDNPENYTNVNVIEKLDKLKQIKPFMIDCGTEDRIYVTNKEFYEKCLGNKIPLTFISQPGKHDRAYWGKAILNHFNFFRKILESANN